MANPFIDLADPKKRPMEGGFGYAPRASTASGGGAMTPNARAGGPGSFIESPPPSPNAQARAADPTIRYNPSIKLLEGEAAKRAAQLRELYEQHKPNFQVDAQHTQLWKDVTTEGKQFSRVETQYNKIMKQLNTEKARLGQFNRGITSFLGPTGQGDGGTAPQSSAIDPKTGLPTAQAEQELAASDEAERLEAQGTPRTIDPHQAEADAAFGALFGEQGDDTLVGGAGILPRPVGDATPIQPFPPVRPEYGKLSVPPEELFGNPYKVPGEVGPRNKHLRQPVGDVVDFDKMKKRMLEGGYGRGRNSGGSSGGGSVTKFPGRMERESRKPLSETEKYNLSVLEQRSGQKLVDEPNLGRPFSMKQDLINTHYEARIKNAQTIKDFNERTKTIEKLQDEWFKALNDSD